MIFKILWAVDPCRSGLCGFDRGWSLVVVFIGLIPSHHPLLKPYGGRRPVKSQIIEFPLLDTVITFSSKLTTVYARDSMAAI